MTTITETRKTSPAEGGKTYTVQTPAHLATDAVFDTFFAEQLREFLHRRGINVSHIPDETLLTQTRNTFANVSARQGRIHSARAVQSLV